MEYIRPIRLRIADKLRSKKYRAAFFRGKSQDEVALRIRELRHKRNEKTQKQVAEISGMKQSHISRIEKSEYSSWNFKTLLRIAEALDAKVNVTFELAEEIIAKQANLESPAGVAGVAQITPRMEGQIGVSGNVYGQQHSFHSDQVTSAQEA